jgi:hypothetical protein
MGQHGAARAAGQPKTGLSSASVFGWRQDLRDTLGLFKTLEFLPSAPICINLS